MPFHTMIIDNVMIAAVLLPRSMDGSIPKIPKTACTAGLLPFKMAFHTVPTTALDESTGINKAPFAIFARSVCFRDAINAASNVDTTI